MQTRVTTRFSRLRERERSARAPESVDILGVRIHNVTMEHALVLLEEMAGDGERHHVVTVNPEFIMTARQNAHFRSVLNNASLSLADGAGVMAASRVFGTSLAARVTGVDIVESFAPIATRRKFRFYFLGAAPGVAEMAADRLRERWPGLTIAGTYAGSPRPEEEEEICARVNAAAPHVLLVAYGSPHQDLWISRNRHRLDVPVAIGVGGTLDYLAEIVPRAPAWLRRFGFEWLYRLIRQPRRWRRMLALPKFTWLVLGQRTKTLLMGTNGAR